MGERPCQISMQIGCNGFGMLQHIVIPITEHTIAISFQHHRSLRIIAQLHGMLSAVDLDDQLRLWAQEIDDISVDRHLPSEAKTLDLSCA